MRVSEPLVRHGPGRRGGVGPGARRPPSDHKPEALVERGGSLQLQFRLSRPGGRSPLRSPSRRPPSPRPSTVTIRIEGGDRHAARGRPPCARLRRRPRPGQPEECKARAPAGALEVATNGDWDRPGRRQLGVLGRADPRRDVPFNDPTATSGSSRVNNRRPRAICTDELQEGDEVLFFVDRCSSTPTGCANDRSCRWRCGLPAAVQTASPSTVTVVARRRTATPRRSRAPRHGHGVDATTGGDGKASVTFGPRPARSR